MPDTRHDQATGLRRLFSRDATHVLGIRGGDGSAATTVTLDLAAALVTLGHRPLVIDLERGEAANALGLKARYDFAHVLCGDKALADVLLFHDAGVAVLPAARGLAQAASRGSWKRTLADLLRDVDVGFNIWLVNGCAPVAESDPPLFVVAPTRAAITAAYAQIKSLARSHQQREFRIVVDQASSESVAESVYRTIADTARRFLSARLDYCGYLPRDDRRAAPAASNAAAPATSRSHALSRLAESVFGSAAAQPAPEAVH